MAKAPTKKALIDILRIFIENGEREVSLNLINLGTTGSILRQMLRDAGYTTKDEGCPQQTWTLDENLAGWLAEQKALDEIEAHNRDMYENPDSYFEPDDPRRAW